MIYTLCYSKNDTLTDLIQKSSAALGIQLIDVEDKSQSLDFSNPNFKLLCLGEQAVAHCEALLPAHLQEAVDILKNKARFRRFLQAFFPNYVF